MTYQVLARKWRPQDFSSVIGQEPIVTALRNALSEGRIAQAYLFSGIRGVGKTSVARVFAKALNCENGPAADPCNECQTCEEITSGADLDVNEVDAATYSKVEQVRELTEGLKYGPARDRYKVVVIDEIHRLSRQAFDALLKIVEEPPAHLVFIFATTEIDSVPATILSRCQEFHFRRVRPAQLTAHLRELADQEGFQASDTALRLLARAGEGSVRDAVALLDQLATFGSGVVDDEQAARILGGVGAAVHHRLLDSILSGLGEEIAAIVHEIEQEGWDPRHVYAEFLAYCRDALHLALGARPQDLELPEEDAARLARLAETAGYENLLRLLHQLLASEASVRRSDAGTLAAEIAWLRGAELPKLTRIEELLAGGGDTAAPDVPMPPARGAARRKKAAARPQAAAAAPAETTATPAETTAAPAETTATPAETTATPAETTVTPAEATVAPADKNATAGDPEQRLQAFLTEVSRRRQSLAAHLHDAEELSFADGELRIFLPPDDDWLATALARGNNRQLLEECLAAVWGEGARWQLLEAPGTDSLGVDAPPPDPALDHPFVQTALDIFGGRAEAVNGDDS